MRSNCLSAKEDISRRSRCAPGFKAGDPILLTCQGPSPRRGSRFRKCADDARGKNRTCARGLGSVNQDA